MTIVIHFHQFGYHTFKGYYLHLVVNDRGELLACRLTPGNADDRKPVPGLVAYFQPRRVHAKCKVCELDGEVSPVETQPLVHLRTSDLGWGAKLAFRQKMSTHSKFLLI
jgi:hypothetical protein